MMQDTPRTRRTALKAGLGLLAAAGASAAATRPARAQSGKAAPNTVAYQDKPSNGQLCSGCSQFVPPNACLLVSGTISPNGWCELYSPKS